MCISRNATCIWRGVKRIKAWILVLVKWSLYGWHWFLLCLHSDTCFEANESAGGIQGGSKGRQDKSEVESITPSLYAQYTIYYTRTVFTCWWICTFDCRVNKHHLSFCFESRGRARRGNNIFRTSPILKTRDKRIIEAMIFPQNNSLKRLFHWPLHSDIWDSDQVCNKMRMGGFLEKVWK